MKTVPLRHGLFGLVAVPVLCLLLLPRAAHAFENELIVTVQDPSGLPVQAQVALLSWASHFESLVRADEEGIARFKRIPAGVYRLLVSYPGFDTYSEEVEIRSEVPIKWRAELEVSPVAASIEVTNTAPLLDTRQASVVNRIGRQQLDESRFSTLGRDVVHAVNSLPGWLLEANAVLHPRGSEYDTQYVIDGMPYYDNRSIGFAPPFESSEFEAVNVKTGSFPAEFGRRLGGVIELHTRRAGLLGHHPELSFQGGSFETTQGALANRYLGERGSWALGMIGGRTERYLDPPSLENFTNKAHSLGFYARAERDLTDWDRLSGYVRSKRVNFLVPNDPLQQMRGQRQDRRGTETAGLVRYRHVFSPRAFAVAQGMVRDISAELWSNRLSTPVFIEQDRGLSEAVAIGSVTIETEAATFKFGGDVRVADLDEEFRFAESGELPSLQFDFRDQRRVTDSGFFAQQNVRHGGVVLDAGIRFDNHQLFLDESAWSPRVGLGYYWDAADLMLRASYDRVFQPPPIENLLLSSSLAVRELDPVVGALPVPMSRANFYEVGIRKPLGHMRLDVSHYWRDFNNFFDDDLFINTGVSFPIAFDSARVEGTEVRIEMPRYKNFSTFVSYSNMLGTATSPVTGGLFVEGGEARELRNVAAEFSISQDQRNTVEALVRYEPHRRLWLAGAVRYGSGLPVELEDDGDDEDAAPEQAAIRMRAALDEPPPSIPPEIIDKVNFERGRVRPNFNLDLSVGWRLWQQDTQSLGLQFDVINLTGRFNVINFSGLFSGTALAPGRMLGVKLRLTL